MDELSASASSADARRTRRRETFARVKDGVVAIILVREPTHARPGEVRVGPAEIFEIVGSGFICEPGPVVVTAAHVLERCRNAVISAELRSLPQPSIGVAYRRFVGIDPEDGLYTQRHDLRPVETWSDFRPSGDLAVARVRWAEDDLQRLCPLPLAGEPAQEGDEVVICGFPHGHKLGNNSTVNASFASGHVAAILPGPDCPRNMRYRVQVDIATLGGNSGGPVFSPHTGEVLGVIVNDYSRPEPQQAHDGSTYQVPVTRRISFAEDIGLLVEARADRDIFRAAPLLERPDGNGERPVFIYTNRK